MEAFQDKLSKILEKVEKMDKIESQLSNISTQLNGIDGRLTTLEGRTTALEKQHDELSEKTAKFTELQQSVEFLSTKYDEMMKVADSNTKNVTDLRQSCTQLTAENIMLKGMLKDFKNNMEQEKVARNEDSQYFRTSHNIKICGMPIQPGEDIKTENPHNIVTGEVVTRICVAAGINLPEGAIDVCHRLGDNVTSPIIIRFSGKYSRYAFFNQRQKLKKITLSNVNLTNLPVIDQPQRETRGNRNSRDQVRDGAIPSGDSKIYVQEHLTRYTKELLKVTKLSFGNDSELQFKYPGYIMHGQVRFKRAENDKYEVIRCASDIKRVLTECNTVIIASTFDHL